MSSRQVRKLRQQQELLEAARRAEQGDDPAKDPVDDVDDAPEVIKPQKNSFARFAALGNENGGGDDDDDDDDDDDEDSDDLDVAQARDAKPSPPEPSQPTATESKKTKKKKKKKKEKAQKVPEKAASDAVEYEGLDEIDRAIRDLQASPSPAHATSVRPEQGNGALSHERLLPLLRINLHHLKVINEMRRLFGRDVIESAQTEESAETMAARRRGAPVVEHVDLETYLKGQPGQSLSDLILRKNPFVDGKTTWPRASAGGLTMKAMSCDGGITEFAFAHDSVYAGLEKIFFSFAIGHDAMPLVQFLHHNPYHVSSLLQVSKVAKQDQNSALAADLCERALFTMGRITLSAFRRSLEAGKARLDFRRPENRQFWLAGYHYVKSLIQKGTFRTALEWTKLILSLDPRDPFAILNWIHPLAIRAHEAQWLVDLFDSGGPVSHGIECETYFRQTLVLAWLQLKDEGRARVALQDGMQSLPWVYCSLLSALNLDAPRSLWGIQPRDEEEGLHTELYVHLTKDLWNNTQAIQLLEEVAGSLPKPDMGKVASAQAVKLATARFVYLDNTPSLLAMVPRQYTTMQPNYDFDPLPPPREENIFSNPDQERPWTASREEMSFEMMQADLMRAGGAAGVPIIAGDRVQGVLQAWMREATQRQRQQDAADGEDAAPGEDEEGDGARPGVLRRFLELVWPLRVSGPGADDTDDFPPLPEGLALPDDLGIEFVSDEAEATDDEMPPLERVDSHE